MHRKIVLIFLLLTIPFVLTACTNKTVGIGANKISFKKLRELDKPMEVLLIKPKDAIRIAKEIAEQEYSYIKTTSKGLIIEGGNPLQGNFAMTIQPIYLKDNETQQVGISYLVSARGVGTNATLAPGMFVGTFYKELEEYRLMEGIETRTFTNYTAHYNMPRSTIQTADVPLTIKGFAFWMKKRDKRSPYEGVYMLNDGSATIGIYHDTKDYQYPFKGVVLESNSIGWRSGDIIIRFRKLQRNRLCLSRYDNLQETDLGLAWIVRKDMLVSKGHPGGEVMLIKDPINDILGTPERATIASSDVDFRYHNRKFTSLGSGTAWAISNKYLVTCEHVVDTPDGHYFLKVGHDYMKARVVASDPKLDVAVLKLIDSELQNVIPLSIRKQKILPTASRIYIMGYPHSDILGEELKITEGIVNSQSGFQGNVQSYQVSAEAAPGNSGGPTVDAQGNVVGVLASGVTRPDITNAEYIVKYQFLKEFLRAHDVPFKEERSTMEIPPQDIYQVYKKSIFLVNITKEIPN